MATLIDIESLVDAIASAVIERLRPMVIEAQATKARLLTVEQAAVYLGRTPDAVRSMQYRGTIPFVRIDSRVQFDVRDLDRWIEQNKATS